MANQPLEKFLEFKGLGDVKIIRPKLSDSNTLSFPDLIGESRRRPRESGELYIRNWIPVFTGNPGFSGQARE